MQLLFAILTALDPYQPPPVEYQHPPVIQGTATQEPEAAPVVKAPHIIATVADRGCGPCNKWKEETLPALEKAGWRVQVNVVPFGSQAVPEFRMGSRVLEGYTTRDAFYSWVKPTGPSATGAVARGVAAVPVVSSVPRDPRPGHWSFPGDIRSHLMRPPHSFSAADLAGLSYEQLLTLHDLNHENGYRPQRVLSQPRTTYAAPVYQSTCPTCPGYRR